MENTYLVRAGNRVRTGDLHVGNVTLYQLSYSRGMKPEINRNGAKRQLAEGPIA